jgi:hypothetical protein
VRWTCPRGCGATAAVEEDVLAAHAAGHDRVCPRNPAAAEHRTPRLAALDQWRARAQTIRNAGGGMILVPVEVFEGLLDQAARVEGVTARCREVVELTEAPTVALVKAETVVRMLDG